MKLLLVFSVLCIGALAQFSESGKRSTLDAHNRIRSQIAKGQYVARGTKKPTGSNMRKLVWDSALATQAQNYANRCPTGHSTDQGIGENLFYHWSGSAIGNLDHFGPDATVAWANEFQDFGWLSNRLNMALYNTGVGHATQVAWAKTHQLGCGVKNCGPDGAKGGMNRVIVVCQYKIQGNYLMQNIYDSGATCSKCPAGTSCEQSSGLCA